MEISKIFTYGTLEIPEVMAAVTGQTFSFQEVIAKGFARYLMQDRIYPGMILAKGETTSGRLYTGLDARTFHILDEFEDELYRRELITVHSPDGERSEAYSYIVPLEHQNILTSQPWCRDYFIDHCLHAYVTSCQAFIQDINKRL